MNKSTILNTKEETAFIKDLLGIEKSLELKLFHRATQDGVKEREILKKIKGERNNLMLF